MHSVLFFFRQTSTSTSEPQRPFDLQELASFVLRTCAVVRLLSSYAALIQTLQFDYQFHAMLLRLIRQLLIFIYISVTDFTALCYVERGIATASCSSVTLKYHDHIGWNASEIILRLVALAGVFALRKSQPHH